MDRCASKLLSGALTGSDQYHKHTVGKFGLELNIIWDIVFNIERLLFQEAACAQNKNGAGNVTSNRRPKSLDESQLPSDS